MLPSPSTSHESGDNEDGNEDWVLVRKWRKLVGEKTMTRGTPLRTPTCPFQPVHNSDLMEKVTPKIFLQSPMIWKLSYLFPMHNLIQMRFAEIFVLHYKSWPVCWPAEFHSPSPRTFQGPVQRTDSIALSNSGLCTRLSGQRPEQPGIGEHNAV